VSLRRLDDELRAGFDPRLMMRSEFGLLVASGEWGSFRRLWMLAAFAVHGNEELRAAALAAFEEVGVGGWPQSLRALVRAGVPLTARGRVLSLARGDALRLARESSDGEEQVCLLRCGDAAVVDALMRSSLVSRELVVAVFDDVLISDSVFVHRDFGVFLWNPAVLRFAGWVGEWVRSLGSVTDGRVGRVLGALIASPLGGCREVGLVLVGLAEDSRGLLAVARSGGVLCGEVFDALLSVRELGGVPLGWLEVSGLHRVLAGRADVGEGGLLRLLRVAAERGDEGVFGVVVLRRGLSVGVARVVLELGGVAAREGLFLNKFFVCDESVVRLGLGDVDGRVRAAAAVCLSRFRKPDVGLVREFLSLGEVPVSCALARFLSGGEAGVVLGGVDSGGVRVVLESVGDLDEEFFVGLLGSSHWDDVRVRALAVAHERCPERVLRVVIAGGGELGGVAVRHVNAVGLLGWAGGLSDSFVLGGVGSVTRDRGVFERLLRLRAVPVVEGLLRNGVLLRVEDVRGLLARGGLSGRLLSRLLGVERRLLGGGE
jgi:hypothetical protein